MEKRTLGRTGFDTTVLGFGAMEVRGPRVWGGRDLKDEQAETILNAVLDAGINLIDTAWDYGRSEEYIGRYISGRRAEYFLATKCGCTFEDQGDHDDTPHVWTRENIMRNIDGSLRRMKTDHVDLLQLHNPTVQQVEDGDLVTVLKDIQTAGKTRFIGCSSTLPDISTFIEWNVFDAFQIPYSALEPEHEDVIARAGKAGAGTIIRGGVARGEPGAGLGSQDRWKAWEAAGLDDLLSSGESRTTFLLRYTISHPEMDTTIVGTLSPEHLQENVRGAEAGPLPADVYAEAKRRLEAAMTTA